MGRINFEAIFNNHYWKTFSDWFAMVRIQISEWFGIILNGSELIPIRNICRGFVYYKVQFYYFLKIPLNILDCWKFDLRYTNFRISFSIFHTLQIWNVNTRVQNDIKWKIRSIFAHAFPNEVWASKCIFLSIILLIQWPVENAYYKIVIEIRLFTMWISTV